MTAPSSAQKPTVIRITIDCLGDTLGKAKGIYAPIQERVDITTFIGPGQEVVNIL